MWNRPRSAEPEERTKASNHAERRTATMKEALEFEERVGPTINPSKTVLAIHAALHERKHDIASAFRTSDDSKAPLLCDEASERRVITLAGM